MSLARRQTQSSSREGKGTGKRIVAARHPRRSLPSQRTGAGLTILVIGSGGREHVLAWKIAQSPLVKKIYCAPGNGGIAAIAECVALEATNIDGLLSFAQEKKIDLTVVGPEAPLAAGIVDRFTKAKMAIFGPMKEAAQLEGSKVFAKLFMRENRIPTAAFEIFDSFDHAFAYIEKVTHPVVIKADGLAAGKGVVVSATKEESRQALKEMMVDKAFADAGTRVVIEECLVGEEVSILAVSDGATYRLLASSQDHKRIYDNDKGPNTGGMGAYSPAPVADAALLRRVKKEVIEPVIAGMKKRGTPFTGVLYAGIMVTRKGPQVLEFNVRLGDPEAQAVLPRLKTDIVELMRASVRGRLSTIRLAWDTRPCVCVVMAAGGYPGAYQKGVPIAGLADASAMRDILIFHAGTKRDGETIVTAGGRVLGVTGVGRDIAQAIAVTYTAVDAIRFEGCSFRRDIGGRALKRGKK